MRLAAALIGFVLAQAADPLVGTWRGTSLCQVKPSPCNDEIAVYHVSATGAGAYHVVANKVVAGVEGPMGTIDATYDAATHTLRGVTFDRQHRPGRWTFVIAGDRWHGTLTTPDGHIFRKIELSRAGA